jgi:hypothetical protein
MCSTAAAAAAATAAAATTTTAKCASSLYWCVPQNKLLGGYSTTHTHEHVEQVEDDQRVQEERVHCHHSRLPHEVQALWHQAGGPAAVWNEDEAHEKRPCKVHTPDHRKCRPHKSVFVLDLLLVVLKVGEDLTEAEEQPLQDSQADG